MQVTDNTILITGGSTGIGRGLAEAFHALGNQVIITGRNQKNLDAVAAAHPGLKAYTVDKVNPAHIRAFAGQIIRDFPALNVVINNAGISKAENLLAQPEGLADVHAMVATNVFAPIEVTAALLPHLLKQSRAAVINVSSGLAFLPLAVAPTYSATKAFLHSYTESLRYQLKDTPVEVLELIPPYVQTTLGGEHQATDPHAMPLADFIAEVMDILKNQPDATEINVQNVHPLRHSSGEGLAKYDQQFKGFNDAMTAHFAGK